MTDPDIRAELNRVSENYRSDHLKTTIDVLERIPGARAAVDRGITKFVEAFPENADTLTKATLLYDVLTSELTYNRKQMDTHLAPYTFIDGLFQKKAVCMGISELYTILATRLGLDCLHVVGYADATVARNPDLHCWNAILLDNKQWYFMDVTFDLHQYPGYRRHWYLKCEKDMKGHHLDHRMLSKDLCNWPGGVFPIARTSWAGHLPEHPKTAELRRIFRGIHP